ncbi:hypothetical protein ACFLZW_05740, partial [Chloroflexota bacterium]
VQSLESLVPAIMDAIDLPAHEKGDSQVHLLDYLRERNLLLVMDGFEHLLEGAGLLTKMLQTAPQLKILVTSRARLNIKGEQLYPLPGMRYPERVAQAETVLESDAVRLFLTGARRVWSEFEPHESDLSLITQVCRQVEGMPLGILLAASWMAALSLEEIVTEIASGPDFLSADWTDMPARQRSMRGTFDHSWALLNQREREIVQSLSIFRGGFTRKAAYQVNDASNHELRALVDKSLLLNRLTGRYDMHELLRQYGAEKLLASPETQKCVYERYSAYYAQALERWTPEIKSPNQEEALDRIDIEHENLRGAWNWAARQGDNALLTSMLDGLCLYYDLRVRYQEGLSACRLASENMVSTDNSADVLPLRAHCQIWESRFYRLLGQNKHARDLLAESQALLDSAHETGLDTRRESAMLDLEMGQLVHDSDLETAHGHYLRCIQSFQELNDNWRAATIMPQLAYCATQRGDYAEAKSWLDKCLPVLRTHGDPRNLAKGLRYKSNLISHLGQLDQALKIMQEAFLIYQSLGEQANIAEGLYWLALAFGYHGRFPDAGDLLVQGLALYQELGFINDITKLNYLLGKVKLYTGEYPQVKGYTLKSLSLAQENDYRREIGASLMTLGMLAIKEGDSPGAQGHLREAITHCRKIQNRDELGTALATLGYAIFIQQGESQKALGYLCEALQISIEIRAPFTLNYTFPPIAVILARRGEQERALEIYSLVMQNPYVANNCWFEDVYGSQVAEFTKSLPEDVAAAAQERGRRRDLWQTVKELMEEFNCPR